MAQDVQVITEADVNKMWDDLEYGRDGLPVVEGVDMRVTQGWRNHAEIQKIGAGGTGEVYRWESRVRAPNVRT